MTTDTALTHLRKPTVHRPLLGLTVLAVEDSLFTCDALRLMCLHSGARLRRADCLKSARRHLKVYRPSVVIVDMGLPDGSGAELIQELSTTLPRVDVLLGCSGDAFAQDIAFAAGADGFLEKPIATLGAFQHAILCHLPEDARPWGAHPLRSDVIQPDAIAFREDMAYVADLLSGPIDDQVIGYVSAFVRGVARSAEDTILQDAAADLSEAHLNGAATQDLIARLNALVEARREDALVV